VEALAKKGQLNPDHVMSAVDPLLVMDSPHRKYCYLSVKLFAWYEVVLSLQFVANFAGTQTLLARSNPNIHQGVIRHCCSDKPNILPP
jgi:hypothetical protein